MPLSRDPEKGGREKDGTKSTKYCSYCFQEGEFTSPEIDTPQKMQTFCIKKMTEQGMSRWLAWIFTRSIPRLERWKKSDKR